MTYECVYTDRDGDSFTTREASEGALREQLEGRLAQARHEFGALRHIDPIAVTAILLPLMREHVAVERETKSVVHECCEARQTAEVELERLRTVTGMADEAGARILDERNAALAAIERARLEIPNWGTKRSRDALLRALDGTETAHG